MNKVTDNRGVVTFGGTTTISESAVGDGATVNIGSDTSKLPTSKSRRKWDIGVVTILAEETKAVRDVFGLKGSETAGRPPFYTGTVEAPRRSVNMVATRTLQPGQGSVMSALENLRRYYDPAALVLVGIGGGIHRDVALDDVVVATRVVFYDMRKVTPRGVLPRGEERQSPAWMMHAVNWFFTDHRDPAELSVPEVGGRTNRFQVFHGPIGSGNAVIADRENDIRRYLSAYNEKILAVDTEAGGLSQFCHETSSTSSLPGWVVIRGISDHADHAKNDDHHISSAMNAAYTLREMIPYIATNINQERRPSSDIDG